MTSDFYGRVPKDLVENLKFREQMVRWGSQGPKYAQDVACACARDLLFWINTFLWIYEARPDENSEGGRMIPFITWGFQDETFLAMEECYGKRDMRIEKSRDMGASWMALTFALWKWQFHKYNSILMVSRNESLVDSKDNPDAIFPKLRMLLRWQPRFLTPTLGKSDDAMLHLFNPETDSVIDGASTTSNTGVGGRRTMMLLDEFALVEDAAQMFSATRDVSRNRVFVSSARGEANQFFKIKKTNAYQISLHWSRHPLKNRGLYKVTNGRVEILDQSYKFPENYRFIQSGAFFRNGGYRSPWYDAECARASHPREIKQELDIDYLGSVDQFFGLDVIERQQQGLLDPYSRGELNYDKDSLGKVEFAASMGGRCLLWLHVGEDGKPIGIEHGVILGMDTSQGTGSSNSCLIGRCRRTGTQLFEFADPNMDPYEFGRFSVVVARWLNNAHIVPEANGPGQTAIKAITDANYSQIYYRRDYDKPGAQTKETPGWWSSAKSKHWLLDNYQFSLRSARITERSKSLLNEMQQYVWTPAGVVHAGANDDSDASGAREQHGDRVIAAALSQMRFTEIGRINPQEATPAVKGAYGTFGWLRERLERQMHDAESRQW